jgi:hypothetical protein
VLCIQQYSVRVCAHTQFVAFVRTAAMKVAVVFMHMLNVGCCPAHGCSTSSCVPVLILHCTCVLLRRPCSLC